MAIRHLMKLVVCIGSLMVGASARANLLLGWNLAGLPTNPVPGSVTSTVNDAALEISVLSRGVGLVATGGTNSFVASSWTLPAGSTITDAVTSNDYFTFTATASGTNTFSVTNFSWRSARSGTGPSNFILRSSADGFASDLATWANISESAANRTTTLNLAGLTNVEFRLYGFAAAGNAGTARITDGANFGAAGIDLALFGQVNAGPPAPPPTNVQFTIAAASIGEAGGAYTVTVYKTLAAGNVSGSVALGGTAANPADYTIDTTNFTMNGAVTSATFVITIVDDGDEEPDETVVLTLANVAGAGIGSPGTFTLTILDNDASPPPAVPTNVLTFQRFEVGDPWSIELGAANVSSSDGSADFPPLQRIQEGVNSWQVNNGSVTLQLAQVSIEGYTNRVIKARVSSTSGTSGNGADGPDIVRFGVALDTDSFPASYAVALAGNSNARWGYWATNSIDVSATTTNSFAAPQGGTSSNNFSTIFIRIPDASTSVALRVWALNNDANEFWNVDNIEILGDPSGPPPPPPTNVQFTASSDTVDEDVGTYTVTVFKSLASGDVGGQVHLGGTATLGADYTIDTTNFTMNGATTSATFIITVADDAAVESTETIILTLTNVVGGTISSPSVFTLSITDNDAYSPAQTAYIIAWWGSVGAYTGNAADDDGDGYNNLEEFIAGTIPVPPAGATNYFRMTQISVSNVVGALISTPSVTGRLYRLWATPTLAPTQDWSQVAGPLAGNGGMLSLTNSAAATTRVYRITVELENP